METCPAWRQPFALLNAAKHLNRDIGGFRKAWIVGTNPLAVAFLESSPQIIPPDVQAQLDRWRNVETRSKSKFTTRPSTRPGVPFDLVMPSGEVIPMDFRVRDATFVTDQDLQSPADVVLLYPQDMELPTVGDRMPDLPRVKVFYLRQPHSLHAIMKMMTQPGALERQAEKVEEAPVLLHPNQPTTAPASTQPAAAPAQPIHNNDLPVAPDNAALQYWQAFWLVSGDIDTLRAAKPVKPDDGLSLTAQLVGSNSNAVRYLHRGAAMSSANWGLAYEDGIICSFVHVERAKHLAQAGLLWARQAAYEKRISHALTTTADVIALARHVAADPTQVTLSSACEIQDDAVKQIAEQLTGMPKDALAKFSNRLASLLPMPTLEKALIMDQKMIRQTLREAQTQLGELGPGDPKVSIAPEMQAAFPVIIEQYDELIRMSRLPPDQWPEAEEAFLVKLRAMRQGNIPLITPRTLKQNRAIARSQVRFRLLQAAVAVVQDGPDAAERFIDPYLNKPIAYRAVEGGFKLVSEVQIDGEPIHLRIPRAELAAQAPVLLHPNQPTTAPATTSPASPAVPATAPVDADLQEAVRAYRDAFQARDRETMREMVFLPSDPQRRQWVLDTLDKGLFPPPGAKMLAIDVKMDGPVAVCEGKLQMPDGSVEQGGPMFFVQRDGRWYFVIDMFEGGDLTQEELEVIGRHIMGEDEEQK